MAVIIQVLKNGKPVRGVSVYYRKEHSGNTGEKTTDDTGSVSFSVNPGMAAIVRLRGGGIHHEEASRYLNSGPNVFKF